GKSWVEVGGVNEAGTSLRGAASAVAGEPAASSASHGLYRRAGYDTAAVEALGDAGGRAPQGGASQSEVGSEAARINLYEDAERAYETACLGIRARQSRGRSGTAARARDRAELHLHGGRAVVAAVSAASAARPGLRAALPGEFTRRAFANGRIDSAEAEGLADSLTAETELQRRAASAMADGALSRSVAGWRDKVSALSAGSEAALDFSDEDDVGADLPAGFAADALASADDLAAWSARPRAEPLR
ncbi:hypothetical protein OY671_008635, partial [Metschnikowia pulcherrima]